jgi:hypothetical protein
VTVEEFAAGDADGLEGALLALWWDGRGDWARAHEIAQEVEGRDGAWVHAYLHRKEGDLWNAGYWYRPAGRAPAGGSLEAEWRAMVGELLGARGLFLSLWVAVGCVE